MIGWIILGAYALALSGWLVALRLRRKLHTQAEHLGGLLRRGSADLAHLAAACQRMQRAADEFREAYLRELARSSPDIADRLRRKWAAQNAPVHVAQLLKRARHG